MSLNDIDKVKASAQIRDMAKTASKPPRPVMIGIRTSEAVKRAAERAAKAEGRTLSNWGELALVARLQELKDGKK